MDSPTWMMNEQRFFKIIKRTDMLFLRFPPVFVEQNLTSPPDEVVVSTGDGKDWDMYISRDARGLMLDAGWPAFRENYDLKLNDVLVFLYDRSSRFAVSILEDSTRMERPIRLLATRPVVAADGVAQHRGSSCKRPVQYLELDDDMIQCSQRKVSESSKIKSYGKDVRTGQTELSPLGLSKKLTTPLSRYSNKIGSSHGGGLFGRRAGEGSSGMNEFNAFTQWASDIGGSGGIAFANIDRIDRRAVARSNQSVRSGSMPPAAEDDIVIQLNNNNDLDHNDLDHNVPDIVGPVVNAVPLNDGVQVPTVIILPDPCCYALARHDYIKKGLEIPYLWATKHFVNGDHQRVLVVDDPPSVTPVVCHLENGECRIKYGWLKFVVENDIKENDLLSFQVDPFDTNVWMTSIYKAKD